MNCRLYNSNFSRFFLGLSAQQAKRAEFKSSLDCFTESYQLRKGQLGENHVDTVEAARFVAAIERKLHSGR